MSFRGRGVWGGWVLALGLLGAACDETEPPLLTERAWDREVARKVTVRGLVADGENGQPVAGAEITLPDGERAVTGSDGRFALETTPGRKRAEVRSNDYLRFTHELVAGEVDFDSSIRVARRGPSQTVGMSGGMLVSEEALVVIPPGAYPDGSAVSVTALKRSRVAAVPAPAQFVDDTGVPRRVVGVVALEGSSAPSVPLRVRAPVAPDATMDTVLLHRINQAGDWSNPTRPESIVAGLATFAVSEDGQYGVSMDAVRSDAQRIGYVVTEGGDSSIGAGTVLTGGTMVATGTRVVALVDPRGATIEVAPFSLVTLQEPASADVTPGTDAPDAGIQNMAAPFAGRVRAMAGEGRVVLRRRGSTVTGRTLQTPSEDQYKLMLALPTVEIAVKGTAFTFSTCMAGTGNLDTVGVVEGEVDAFYNGEPQSIDAGQSRTFCPTCPGNTMPECGQAPEPPRMARLTVAPSEVIFDDLLVGETGSAHTLTLTNEGDAATGTLSSGLGSAVAGPFEIQTNGCAGEVLDPSETCQVVVVFKPTAAGTSQGEVTVSGDPGGTASVVLSGRGLAPARLYASPNPARFEPQVQGSTSAPQILTFTNDGDLPSGPLDTRLQGAAAEQFGIESDGCAAQVLGPRNSCRITVLFRPTVVGEAEAEVRVTATPGDGASATLLGRALEPARLGLSLAEVAFDDQLVGTASGFQTLAVSNAGEVATGSLALVLAGPENASFEIIDNACEGILLEAKATCLVSLRFKPTAAGPNEATVSVSGAPGGSASATLTGRGLAPAQLAISPAETTFPDQLAGTTSGTSAFQVTNQGDVATGPLATVLAGAAPAQYQISGDFCTGVALAARASCTVEVAFRPSGPGETSATVRVSGAPGGAASAELAGRGLAPAVLSVSPETLPFGDQIVGTSSAPATVAFTNQGDVATGPIAVALGGPASGEYQISSNGCAGLSLAAGASCTVSLVFQPTVAGDSGAAAVAAGAMPGGTASASLGGRGLAPARLRVSPGSVVLGDVLVGSASNPTLVTVTNDGDVPTGPVNTALGSVSAAEFQLGDNGCQGLALAAKASCTLNVSLVPTVAGDAYASLFVSATPGDTAAVALAGKGLAPAHLSVAPSAVAFADLLLGTTSAPAAVVVRNDGDATSGPLATALTGAASAQYQIGSDGCAGVALAGKTSCTVGLVFKPTIAGTSGAVFTVNGAPGGSAEAPLSGRGLAPASLQVSPAGLPFGDQVLGTSSTPASVIFTNAGDVATGPLAAVVGGPGASQYKIGIDGCSGAPLPAKGSCTVSLVFAPTVAGDAGAAAVAAGGSPGGTTSASLSGRGLRPAQLRVDPPAASFGSHPLGTSTPPLALTFTNDGDQPTGLLTSTLEGDVAPFEIATNGCAAIALPAHGICTVHLFFRPTVAGGAHALVIVQGLPGGSASADLAGQGLEPAKLAISPVSHDFGPVPPGATSHAGFVVSNTGASPTGTLGVSLQGPDLAVFSVAEDACTGRILQPGEGCPLSARFSSHGPGIRSVNLTVQASPGGGVSALLRGAGGEGGGSCTPESCGPGLLCCGGSFCADPRFDQNNCGACGNSCTAGRFCDNGVCRCSPMQAECNGVCTYLQGDPDNCGACGNVCPTGNRFCGGGPGGPACQPCTSIGQSECGGRCVDTRHDQQNCGACGSACAANQACIDGACVTGTCEQSCGGGAICCEGGAEGGGQRCTDPRFDQNNCGGCGVVCGGGRFCNNGVCGCQPGQVECGGVCTFLQGGDPDNCGACGNVCPEGNRFCGGGPGPAPGCQPCSVIGQVECGGRCVDTRNDQNNCGACGNACGVNQACVEGACVTGTCALSCGAGAICCEGGAEGGGQRCTDPRFDQNNCGGCGVVCGSGKYCQNGVCGCHPMQVDCGGVCTTLYGDPDNCGACGNVCPAGSRFCGGGPTPCQPCSTVGQTECGGRCVDTRNDQNNCGTCGSSCAANQACVDGACVTGSCALSCGTGIICCDSAGPEGGGQRCTDPRHDQSNCGGCGIACGGGKFCQNGACFCQPGQIECGGVCTYVQGGDPDNCGACGSVCPTGSRFCGGGPTPCQPCSTIGQTECGGRCVDTRNDQNNCGTCGSSCAANQACVDGACVTGTCAVFCGTGAICCDSAGPAGGGQRCTDPRHDQSNCGGCGIVCGGGQFCQNGGCLCQPGYSDCGGACTYLSGDPDNCGACGNVCPPESRFCVSGPTPTCQSCPGSGQALCDGQCVDTRSDRNNCGGCGTACGEGQSCLNGACITGTCMLSCPTGMICCGTEATGQLCASPSFDPNNCGGCGIVCGGGQSCNNGVCGCNGMQTSCNGICVYVHGGDADNCGACGNVCPTGSRFCEGGPTPSCRSCSSIGQSECGGRCVDTNNDQANCGSCGTSCATNQSCVNGACVTGTCMLSCPGGMICCGSEGSGLFCASPSFDPNNCGGCGIVCGGGQSCNNGACGCNGMQTNCNGSCVYVFGGDADNCGACGTICPTGSRFCEGGPTPSCRSCSTIGQSECGGRCVDTNNDQANCGSCGTSCGTNQSCVNGACVTGTCMLSCPGGMICCGSEGSGLFCASPSFDPNNCGGCGIVCGGGQSCNNGVCGCNGMQTSCNGTCVYVHGGDADNCGACGTVCPTGSRFCEGGPSPTCRPCSSIGQTECGGRCVDTRNDQNNCGTCGTTCGVNQACVTGICVSGQ